MKKYVAGLTHNIHGEPEQVKIAFLRDDGLVLMDGRLHSTVPNARIAAGVPLLICEVVDNDSRIDLQGVENVEIPE